MAYRKSVQKSRFEILKSHLKYPEKPSQTPKKPSEKLSNDGESSRPSPFHGRPIISKHHHGVDTLLHRNHHAKHASAPAKHAEAAVELRDSA
ncbi:MAG: hypothetical protein IPL32_01420 [Chloracidobacterium sp.]|nr:hypothetical protein [Chloracidobacterium sp.]